MKKFWLILIVFVVAAVGLAAEGLDYDIFLRFTLDPETYETEEETLLSSRVGLSLAYDMPLAGLLSPGLKVQIGFSPLGGMIKERVTLFDFSGRLFNAMRFGSLEAQPFFGYTLQLAAADGTTQTNGRLEAGLELIIGAIGFEYAYLFSSDVFTVPAFGSLPTDLHIAGQNSASRIGLSWHARKRN